MNKIITGVCMIVVYCFISCADKEPDHDSSIIGNDTSRPAAIVLDPQKAMQADTALALPTVATPSLAKPLPQDASTVTAAGMNPPHGQPNHRCDIAVGAPLNSPATKPASPVVSTMATTPSVQKTTPKTVTPPGMNPPHGEPGHRCDIAVGAPLNSPVTKPQTITPAVTEPIIIAPKKDSGG
ncbi:MAG: hypothetical protein ABIO04_00720 [Ferruginibacter sp.]